MNVSKKALSLVLALALVTSTFMASGAFADTTGSSSGTSTSVSDSSSNLTTAKEALTAALEAATQYTDSTKYTADTWSTFQVALEDANAINENTNATATTINGAAKALNDAITGLNNAVIAKADLQAQLDASAKYTDSLYYAANYDEAQWANFTNAQETATAQKDNPALLAKIQSAASNLHNAMEVLDENRTNAINDLTNKISEVSNYSNTNNIYASDSWTTFQDKLKIAQTESAITNTDTLAKIRTAFTGLLDAQAALMYKPNLQAEIEKGDSIDGIGNSDGKYDSKAWSDFQVKLEAAKATYEDISKKASDITGALTDLETAIKALVLSNQGESNTINSINSLPSDPTTADPATVKNLAEQVEHFSDSDKKNLTTAEIVKLETALEAVTGNKAPVPSVPDTSAITIPQAQMTQAPTVSGLLLAAGYTGAAPQPTITLETTQEAVSDTANSLAFDVKLFVNGTQTHALAVPVTVTIKLPASFVYNSSYNYTVHHIKDASVGGGYEDLPLKIVGTNGAYTGTFTTNSFSDFTVVATQNSNQGGNNGGTSNPVTPVTPVTPTAPATFVSDTAYNFGVNGSYLFKITSKNGKAPTFAVGTPDVFKAQLIKTVGSDYFYKITAVGAPGACAGIYVNGSKLLVATVKSNPSYVKSDTGRPFSVKAGKSYTFKLTANSKPTFVAGTPGVFKVNFVKQIGKDYFFKITAVGKPGNASGFYIINQSRVTVVTIAK